MITHYKEPGKWKCYMTGRVNSSTGVLTVGRNTLYAVRHSGRIAKPDRCALTNCLMPHKPIPDRTSSHGVHMCLTLTQVVINRYKPHFLKPF